MRCLLQNENYIGNLVYSRTSIKLQGPRVVNPPETWVRKENAFAGIVDRDLFFKAQEFFAVNRKKHKYKDADLLERMRALFLEHGRLSTSLIKRHKPLPVPHTFADHFGSLHAAYRLVGFEPPTPEEPYKVTRRLCQMNQELIGQIIKQLESRGATATWSQRSHVLQINNELRVGILFARPGATNLGSSRWVLRWDARRWDAGAPPDLTMAVRMDRKNKGIQDYYLLPGRRRSFARRGSAKPGSCLSSRLSTNCWRAIRSSSCWRRSRWPPCPNISGPN